MILRAQEAMKLSTKKFLVYNPFSFSCTVASPAGVFSLKLISALLMLSVFSSCPFPSIAFIVCAFKSISVFPLLITITVFSFFAQAIIQNAITIPKLYFFIYHLFKKNPPNSIVGGNECTIF